MAYKYDRTQSKEYQTASEYMNKNQKRDTYNRSLGYHIQNDKLNNYYSGNDAQLRTNLQNQIINREPFKYDLNGDALYQQYKDQYTKLGSMAMQDTIGQASAMTGGFGNSYASTAGNQAYQSYLGQLNDKIPELYQLAYDKYNQEGNDLRNNYNMVDSNYWNTINNIKDDRANESEQSWREAQWENDYNNSMASWYAGLADAKASDLQAQDSSALSWANLNNSKASSSNKEYVAQLESEKEYNDDYQNAKDNPNVINFINNFNATLGKPYFGEDGDEYRSNAPSQLTVEAEKNGYSSGKEYLGYLIYSDKKLTDGQKAYLYDKFNILD